MLSGMSKIHSKIYMAILKAYTSLISLTLLLLTMLSTTGCWRWITVTGHGIDIDEWDASVKALNDAVSICDNIGGLVGEETASPCTTDGILWYCNSDLKCQVDLEIG